MTADSIDPATAVVADSYEVAPEEIGPATAEVGVVVAGDGRVVRYTRSYETREWEWLDITPGWRDDEHVEAIRLALQEVEECR